MPAEVSYTSEIGAVICERLAGGESLRTICADDDMPGRSTVFRWLLGDQPELKAFRDQYARARIAQADTLFDETIDIADDAANDWMQRNGKDSVGYELNGEHIQRSKLRIDTRKWMAGKLAPKKYGEKTTLEHEGKLTLEQMIAKSFEGS